MGANLNGAPVPGKSTTGGATTAFVRANLSRFLKELQSFVQIPSVSSDPRASPGVRRCAEWLASHLRLVGLRNIRLLPTARHPIIYGDWLQAPKGKTVLIYGHYDVQPPGSGSDWKFPPFAASIRDGFIHGRGASDDKGQLFTHLKALEALLQSRGRLPVNVKCLFEGEEEIGSPNLRSFLVRNQRSLQADVAVMSDTQMVSAEQPALTCSLRGQLALELELQGPSHDLHSGSFGGVVHEPLQALCELIARLHDSQGHIAIPGFYDRVRTWSQAEREELASSGPSNAEVLRQAGASRSWGEAGYTLYERLALRPSLAVTGLVGGHAGPGPKGVIPCRALAKLSFRLVPAQDPAEIENLFRRYLQQIAPPTVRVAVRSQIQSRPALIDRKHPAMQAAFRAYQKVFGRAPVWVWSGGTISVVADFQRLFSIPTVLLGFGSPDDQRHAPNERFLIKNFHRGILTAMAFLEEFGGRPAGQTGFERRVSEDYPEVRG